MILEQKSISVCYKKINNLYDIIWLVKYYRMYTINVLSILDHNIY